MGAGIWCMHYVGMLAFRLPVPVEYDWPTVALSLLAAVVSSGVALLIVSRPSMGLPQTIVWQHFIGGGIAAMHYIGMEAMRLPAMCVYSPGVGGLVGGPGRRHRLRRAMVDLCVESGHIQSGAGERR